MSISDMVKGKKEWRAHMARVKKLPQDFQFVYKEIQKYFFKVGPMDFNESSRILAEIVDLFEEAASSGQEVIEVTGTDVAAFCDDLFGDSKTYADLYQEAIEKSMR